MNKILALVLTLLFINPGARAQGFKSPDILVDTKLDADWSGMLVSKIRRLLRNSGAQDPFRAKFDKPMTVYQTEVDQFLNADSRELLTELGHMLDMDFLNGKAQVVVHGLRYDIKGFKTDLKLAQENSSGITIGAEFSASNVRLNADKVVLSLVIPGKKALPVIDIEITKPIIVASEESLINFFTKIQIKSQADKFKFNLQEANFANMAHGLLDNNAVTLDFSGVVVPKVSIKVGNKEIKFDQKKIEDLIVSKKDAIKGLLLAQFSTILAKGFGPEVLKVMDEVALVKEHWFDALKLQSVIKVTSFKSSADGQHVVTQLDGDFCTNEGFIKAQKDCVNQKITKAPVSRITESDHEYSMDHMRDLVEKGDANIVVSVSEDYINRVLATTLDAGLWNNILSKAGVQLGPNKPYLRLDEKNSRTGTLVMDMVYTAKKIQAMAIGTKEVRFPLIMKVGLNILLDNKIPVFTLKIEEVDMSDSTLINGKPEIGAVSNIAKLRLKKKILDTLRLETVTLPNTEVASLRYPALRGLDLEKVDFISDGEGRMNALILMKESVQSEEEAK